MQKEWRIQIPTMNVLFLSIYFAMYIKLRTKSMGKDYPSHVPHHISKIIELEIVSKLSNVFLKGFDQSVHQSHVLFFVHFS